MNVLIHKKDSEVDGVIDDLDICPNTSEESQVDSNGCAGYRKIQMEME